MLKHCRKGFTLIELLVVIAIIAILAAILFPVFAAAREKARTTTCQNNQMQIGRALLMYADAYDGMYPAYNISTGLWPEALKGFLKKTTTETDSVFLCPSTSGTAPGFADANTRWTWSQGQYSSIGSYCHNGWLYDCGEADVKNPANTLFDADGYWIDAWPTHQQGIPKNGKKPPNDAGIERIALDRHQGGVVVTFVDGHAKWYKRDNLYALTFHPFDPQERPNPSGPCGDQVPGDWIYKHPSR